MRSPVAILDGPANVPRVFAVNAAARRAGVQTGMTKVQAEICAGVVLRKRSLVKEESAQAALLACAGEFSPRVESTALGTTLLDLTGSKKLFGSWPRAAQAMTAKAAEVGFEVRVAIAPNPDTAFLAARGFSTNSILRAGEEALRLSSLPISVLPLSPEMRETLDGWGVRTLQALATLPAVAVVERLGQEGLRLQKLAQGQFSRPLLVVEPAAEFATSFEFEDPVETLESIFFVLNRLLQELCGRLLASARAAAELRLTLVLCVTQIQRSGIGSGDRFEHEWKLPVPTQDRNLLFGLVRLHLEQVTFSAPVRLLRVELVPVKPRLSQGNLFVPPSPEPEKLELTLERIRGVVGAGDSEGGVCVGSPRVVDTHRPGSFALESFSSVEVVATSAAKAAQKGSEVIAALKRYATPKSCHPERIEGPMHLVDADRMQRSFASLRMTGPAESTDLYSFTTASSTSGTRLHALRSSAITALRVFRPALETSVELDGNHPHSVRLWNRHRRVLAASGPWSTSGHWWNASAWMREEWDVALQTPAGLGFYRIYRDRLLRSWFVEGVFD